MAGEMKAERTRYQSRLSYLRVRLTVPAVVTETTMFVKRHIQHHSHFVKSKRHRFESIENAIIAEREDFNSAWSLETPVVSKAHVITASLFFSNWKAPGGDGLRLAF